MSADAARQALEDWSVWLSDQDGLGRVTLEEGEAKRLQRDLEQASSATGMGSLQADRAALIEAEALVDAYREAPAVIARLCDKHLDRSGALLGRLRLAAARAGETT